MSNTSCEKSLFRRLIDRFGPKKAASIKRKRDNYLKARANRKQAFLTRCSWQAKLAKAKLMLTDKGRNGRSMSDALVAAHGIKRKEEA